MPFDKTTPPTPVPVPPVEKRRSPAPYILAALIFILGLTSFGVFLFQRLSGMDDKLLQIIVPGAQDVTLSEPGEYMIFHEYHSVVGNEVFSTDEGIAGLQAQVTAQKTGADIPLTPATSSSSYDIAGRSGRAIFQFTIDEPGIYNIEGRYASGADGPRTVLTVSQGFVENIIITVFVGLAIMFGSLTLSIAIAVITFLKRRSAAH